MKRTYSLVLLAFVFLAACGYEDLLLEGPKEDRPVTISTESGLLTMINIMQPDSAE